MSSINRVSMGDKKYGLPYMGSKNRIADWIIDNIPPANYLYDLFSGGCAVTHCAMLSGHYRNFIINDIDPVSRLFIDAMRGQYKDEKRWISREDFFRYKDIDPYISVCWSFGNDRTEYLYSKEIEPWKRALHYARVFGDFSEMEKFGIQTSGSRKDIERKKEEIKEKYTRWYIKNVLKSDKEYRLAKENLEVKIKDESERLRQYLLKGLKESGLTQAEVGRRLGTQMEGHYFGRSQWSFPTREYYEKMQTFMPLPEKYDNIVGLGEREQSLQFLQSLRELQRLQSFQSLENHQYLKRLQRLESHRKKKTSQRIQYSNKDYTDVRVLPNSVLYCDIPYKRTREYMAGRFDHDRFYNWALEQKELVVISEYDMPPEFTAVASIGINVTFSSSGKCLRKKEKLFVPTRQYEMYKRKMGLLF